MGKKNGRTVGRHTPCRTSVRPVYVFKMSGEKKVKPPFFSVNKNDRKNSENFATDDK
jgi:hypothetical protein